VSSKSFLTADSRGANVWRKMCNTRLPEAICRKAGLTKSRRMVVMDLNGMKITPRDQQVLDLLVGGCSNKEIAGQLSISPRTVKQHLRTLFLRAGIKDGRKRVKLAIAVFDQEGANL
jgi:DNA-binding NarL/FixJ family response regulator